MMNAQMANQGHSLAKGKEMRRAFTLIVLISISLAHILSPAKAGLSAGDPSSRLSTIQLEPGTWCDDEPDNCEVEWTSWEVVDEGPPKVWKQRFTVTLPVDSPGIDLDHAGSSHMRVVAGSACYMVTSGSVFVLRGGGTPATSSSATPSAAPLSDIESLCTAIPHQTCEDFCVLTSDQTVFLAEGDMVFQQSELLERRYANVGSSELVLEFANQQPDPIGASPCGGGCARP